MSIAAFLYENLEQRIDTEGCDGSFRGWGTLFVRVRQLIDNKLNDDP